MSDHLQNLDGYSDPHMTDPRGGFGGGEDFEVIAMVDNGAIRKGDGSLYIHEWMISSETTPD